MRKPPILRATRLTVCEESPFMEKRAEEEPRSRTDYSRGKVPCILSLSVPVFLVCASSKATAKKGRKAFSKRPWYFLLLVLYGVETKGHGTRLSQSAFRAGRGVRRRWKSGKQVLKVRR